MKKRWPILSHLLKKKEKLSGQIKKVFAIALMQNVFVVNHRPNYPSESYTQAHKWETYFDNNVFAYFSGHSHLYCYRQISADDTGSVDRAEGNINHFIIGNSRSRPTLAPKNCEQLYVGTHFAVVSIKGSDMAVKIYDFMGKELFALNFKNEHYYE